MEDISPLVAALSAEIQEQLTKEGRHITIEEYIQENRNGPTPNFRTVGIKNIEDMARFLIAQDKILDTNDCLALITKHKSPQESKDGDTALIIANMLLILKKLSMMILKELGLPMKKRFMGESSMYEVKVQVYRHKAHTISLF